MVGTDPGEPAQSFTGPLKLTRYRRVLPTTVKHAE